NELPTGAVGAPWTLGDSGAQSDPSGTPSLSSSVSQASPVPSASRSAWDTFETLGQLSQALPSPSRSVSVWVVFETRGQLSCSAVLGARKPVPTQTPSLS